MKTKRGELPWAEAGGRAQAPWREEFHRDPAGLNVLAETRLTEPPDYEAADRFLMKARQQRVARPSV